MGRKIFSTFLSFLIAAWVLMTVSPNIVLANGTVYLGDSGWSEAVGTWDSATRTAVLTQDVSGSIEITADYITLDGNGHSVTGDGTGDGVHAEIRHHITVKNLVVAAKQNGILFNKTHNSSIENNTISNTERGIYLYEGTSVSILNNQTFSNTRGISIRAYSLYNIIENNDVYLNQIGIMFEGGFNNVVRNNNISSNTTGLTITNDLAFVGGVLVTLVTDDNQIYNNNFIDNTTQAYVYTWLVGEENGFNLGLPTGGNFWSNWITPDTDADGFVDNPYEINGTYQDNLPWAQQDGWVELTPDSLIEDFFADGLIDNEGITNSLLAKLNVALEKIDQGKTKTAINILKALLNEIEAQAGKHIDSEAAQELIEEIQAIIDSLEESLSLEFTSSPSSSSEPAGKPDKPDKPSKQNSGKGKSK